MNHVMSDLIAHLLQNVGLAARLAPEIIRQSAEDERIQVEESDMERIMSQGLGPQDIMDDKHEVFHLHWQ